MREITLISPLIVTLSCGYKSVNIMATNGSESKKITQPNDMKGVSFTIEFDENDNRPLSTLPSRLSNYRKKTISKEDLDQKQMEAKARRKEKEKEMLQRIQCRRDEVEKLNKNFTKLLVQDAKRKGQEGTEHIPALSASQLRSKYHAVNKDFHKMVGSIVSSDVQLPK